MGFITYNPLGKKTPQVITTSNSLVDQLWQEFVMLRYLKGEEKVYASKSIAPWIDQAKLYYLDASHSDWRSAGLLYYYSFLNLAKALLVSRRYFTYKALNTISVYHGLRARLQETSQITDYEIELYPSQQNQRKNIFPYLYKAITNRDWAFNSPITIKLSDIAPYCRDISQEWFKLFGIKSKMVRVQSLIRIQGDKAWFEMAIPATQVDTIQLQLSEWNLQKVNSDQITQRDKEDWLLAYQRSGVFFRHFRLLRSSQQSIGDKNNMNPTLEKIKAHM